MSEVEVPRSDRAPIDARVFSKIGRKAGCKFVIVANPLTEALAKVILKYEYNHALAIFGRKKSNNVCYQTFHFRLREHSKIEFCHCFAA